MNISLHIERLVLDGVSVPAGERHLLNSRVEAELARLLMTGGVSPVLASGAVLPQVFATDVQLARGKDVMQLGGQIARSIYGGIGI